MKDEEKLAVYQASVGDLLALSERPVDAVARSGSPPAAQLLLGTDQQLSARFHKLQSQLSRLDEECLQTHKCHRDVSSEMERTNHILRLGLSTSRARIDAAAVNAMLSNTAKPAHSLLTDRDTHCASQQQEVICCSKKLPYTWETVVQQFHRLQTLLRIAA